MKPLPKRHTFSESVEAVRIYRDDADDLVLLMANAGLEVQMSDDRIVYDSFDEVRSRLGDRPKKLTIDGTIRVPEAFRSYSVSVTLGGRYCHVLSLDEQMFEVAQQLVNLLRKRQTSANQWPVLSIITVAMVLATLSNLAPKSYPVISQTMLTLGLGAFATGACAAAYWWWYPGLVLKFRHQAGFVARNRDVGINAITALVTGVVTYLATYWATRCP